MFCFFAVSSTHVRPIIVPPCPSPTPKQHSPSPTPQPVIAAPGEEESQGSPAPTEVQRRGMSVSSCDDEHSTGSITQVPRRQVTITGEDGGGILVGFISLWCAELLYLLSVPFMCECATEIDLRAGWKRTRTLLVAFCCIIEIQGCWEERR